MKASEVLTNAIDAINNFGWRQFAYGGPRMGGFCAIGALDYGAGWENEAGTGYDYDNLAFNAARMYMARSVGISLPTSGLGISSWNDTEGRTKEEVIAALNQARELALADGQ